MLIQNWPWIISLADTSEQPHWRSGAGEQGEKWSMAQGLELPGTRSLLLSPVLFGAVHAILYVICCWVGGFDSLVAGWRFVPANVGASLALGTRNRASDDAYPMSACR